MELISRMLDGSIPYDIREALRHVPWPGRRVSRDDTLRHLQKVPLLQECTRRQLQAVAGISAVIEAPAGAVLTRRGEVGSEFFLLLDGTARGIVSRRRHFRLAPGDFFGEMSLLDGGPRSATVQAVTPVRLLVINRQKFGALLKTVPDLTQRILVALSRRVRDAERTPTA